MIRLRELHPDQQFQWLAIASRLELPLSHQPIDAWIQS
jgi:hypothetical protein